MVTYGLFVEEIVEEMSRIYSLLDIIPTYIMGKQEINRQDIPDWLSEQIRWVKWERRL